MSRIGTCMKCQKKNVLLYACELCEGKYCDDCRLIKEGEEHQGDETLEDNDND